MNSTDQVALRFKTYVMIQKEEKGTAILERLFLFLIGAYFQISSFFQLAGNPIARTSIEG